MTVTICIGYFLVAAAYGETQICAAIEAVQRAWAMIELDLVLHRANLVPFARDLLM